MPTPQDFCERALFSLAASGAIVAKLDGKVYATRPYGLDAIEILDTDEAPVAILTMRDGKFVPAG